MLERYHKEYSHYRTQYGMYTWDIKKKNAHL